MVHARLVPGSPRSPPEVSAVSTSLGRCVLLPPKFTPHPKMLFVPHSCPPSCDVARVLTATTRILKASTLRIVPVNDEEDTYCFSRVCLAASCEFLAWRGLNG